LGSTISIVAEKPSIARALVRAFSIVYKTKFKGRKGKTRYNYIFESTIEKEKIVFKLETTEYRLKKGDLFLITSVTGHILNFDYPPPYDKETNWHNSDPIEIVDIEPIEKPINQNLVDHISEIGKITDVLIIATDWDGHGEAIGREIVDVASKENKKIRHGRMRFTSTNPLSLQRAFESQTGLDFDWIRQVDSLRKQDLRMGSSITRFLTIGVQDKGIHNQVISYGPCQTSVLYLITNRYLENKAFVPEKFWKISLKIMVNDEPLFLNWQGNPSLDETHVDTVLTTISKEKTAIISDYNEEISALRRPLPLDTDTLEAECSNFLKVSPKKVSDVAERLYNNGFITYPRTESSYYHEKDLTKLTEKFTSHPEFGEIAQECIDLEGVTNPSKGRFTKDHEPIKPVKAVEKKEIAKTFAKMPSIINLAWIIYSYVVWRFLATIHVDAKVINQYIIVKAGEEKFTGEGRVITDLGFLKFYQYRHIASSELPTMKSNDEYPFEAIKHIGFTTPPPLWSESQLIRKMAKLNLGTDATRSSHIDTVQKRRYTIPTGTQRILIPTALGSALYEIFTSNAQDLILPEIRGKIETWTQQIRDQEKTSEEVDKLVIDLTTQGLMKMKTNHEEIFSTLATSIKEMTGVGDILGTCPDCKGNLILFQGKIDARFLKCSTPLCESSFPLPKKGSLTKIEDENCRICNSIPLIVSTKYHSWNMCPVCWTREASKDRPWFCSECNREDCPLSGSWKAVSNDEPIGPCPECDGKVYLSITDNKPKIICNSCEKTWKTPKLRQKMSITLGKECSTCSRQTLSVIKPGKKPYRLCVFCSLFYFDYQDN